MPAEEIQRDRRRGRAGRVGERPGPGDVGARLPIRQARDRADRADRVGIGHGAARPSAAIIGATLRRTRMT